MKLSAVSFTSCSHCGVWCVSNFHFNTWLAVAFLCSTDMFCDWLRRNAAKKNPQKNLTHIVNIYLWRIWNRCKWNSHSMRRHWICNISLINICLSSKVCIHVCFCPLRLWAFDPKRPVPHLSLPLWCSSWSVSEKDCVYPSTHIIYITEILMLIFIVPAVHNITFLEW